MKYLALIIVAICFLSASLDAQLVSRVVEYKPAPGQLINTDAAGSYAAANSVVNTLNGMVSLGAFGGYVVYGFDHPIINDPDNPYGVDFVLFGNVQTDWAEPGIVMVMKDANNNGLPDDNWYELAGSDYFFSTTKKQATVTYYNPLFTGETDVPWTLSDNSNGYIYRNSYHKQNYFPSSELSGGVDLEQIQFTGTLLNDQVDLSNPAIVKCYYRRFGYADNNLRKNSDYSNPDNPYTESIEGCGGDAMDISWAIDGNGNYIDLDQIDFVKIYSGVLANASWCGEISTEIAGIADVPPNQSLIGAQSCVVINRMPNKMIEGNVVQAEAVCFVSGHCMSGEKINWKVDNTSIASISSSGILTLKGNGTLTITASMDSDPSVVATQSVEVVKPAQIDVSIESSTIRTDEESVVVVKVLDASGNSISGLNMGWNIENTDIISFTEKNGKYYLKGLAEGSSDLDVFLSDKPEIKTTLKITVLGSSASKKVFILVKDENSTIIPRNNFTVSNFNLNPFIDNASSEYDVNTVSEITVAHAIAAVFEQAGLNSDFRFRDDDKCGGKLYIWKVPKGDASNVELIYGYGGYSERTSYARCWIVLLNNEQIVNGFDQHLLNNGDELILYHVPDITKEWNVTSFVANKNEMEVNDTVEVYSSELTCALNSEGKVQVNSSSPITFQQVFVNDQVAFSDGDPVTTDETGTAALRFTEAGAKKIAVGIDEMVLTVKSVASTSQITKESSIKIWPQPARESLTVSLPEVSDATFRVVDLSGRCVWQNFSTENKQHALHVSGVAPGLYLLQISTKEGVSNHKIMLK